MVSPKQELRKTLRQQLAQLSPETFRNEGIRAAEFMAVFPPWQNASTVLLFLSAPGEIETASLLDLAFKQGKKVFLPKVEGDIARFFRIKSAEGPWQTGAFGIREPLIEGPVLPEEFPQRAGETGKTEESPALMVTPGMAFDRQGNRMGHGKGYYDKFFAKLDGLGVPYIRVAFCLEQQILPEVPTEPWDKTMNAICSGAGLISIL
ncbi:5-formyltetrahydrofolate cyclo-ligase [Treponema primitia]|uniref:5-formyltetrahydrofolate cyclo-ligase n=1 Tax=Treponema primitia TaxID=88058 RepID=UPI0039807C95